MKNEMAVMKEKLKDLEKRIREAEERLPAHSAKPTTVSMLFDLEDERDALLKRIEELDQMPR